MESFRVDQPIPGYYTMSLARGGIQVPVKIWFGLPIIDDEEQDRGPRWNCEINGKTTRNADGVTELLDIDRAWPWCAKRKIDEAEYRYLIARLNHAKEYRPDHPAANAHKKMDLRSMPSLF